MRCTLQAGTLFQHEMVYFKKKKWVLEIGNNDNSKNPTHVWSGPSAKSAFATPVAQAERPSKVAPSREVGTERLQSTPPATPHGLRWPPARPSGPPQRGGRASARRFGKKDQKGALGVLTREGAPGCRGRWHGASAERGGAEVRPDPREPAARRRLQPCEPEAATPNDGTAGWETRVSKQTMTAGVVVLV